MSDDDDSGSAFDKTAIQKLFLKANGGDEPLSFAFGLGPNPEGCALLLSQRKSPEALKTGVKKAAPAAKKVSWGTFTVASPEVRFLPTKPVKGMVKQLRLRFRDEGLAKFKPILVGPDGAEVDEDTLADEDGEGDENASKPPEAPPAPEARTAPAPVPDALKARVVALKPRIEAAPQDKAGPLLQALSRALAQVRAGDAAGAEQTIGLIEGALDRLGAAEPAAAPPQAPVAGPDAARLTQALTQAVQRIKALPAGPAQQALVQGARRIQGLITTGDTAGALAALREVAAALAQAEKPAPTAAPKEVPLVLWREAKEAVDVGISQLQSALRGIGHPATTRIAEFGLNGLTEGGENTKLMAALMGLERAAGGDRTKAAAAVAAAAQAYRGFLAGNPVVPLVESNPLNVRIDIRGTLGAALDRILADAA